MMKINPARKHNETQKKYRKRLAKENALVKEHLKGTYICISTRYEQHGSKIIKVSTTFRNDGNHRITRATVLDKAHE